MFLTEHLADVSAMPHCYDRKMYDKVASGSNDCDKVDSHDSGANDSQV